MIDTDNAVILDVEATRSVRQAEVGAARTMIDRIADKFNLHPERLIADTAYGSAPMLDWLAQQRGIAPHIPVIDKSGRKDGTKAGSAILVNNIMKRSSSLNGLELIRITHQHQFASTLLQLFCNSRQLPRTNHSSFINYHDITAIYRFVTIFPTYLQ